jgi:hypothetical protein
MKTNILLCVGSLLWVTEHNVLAQVYTGTLTVHNTGANSLVIYSLHDTPGHYDLIWGQGVGIGAGGSYTTSYNTYIGSGDWYMGFMNCANSGPASGSPVDVGADSGAGPSNPHPNFDVYLACTGMVGTPASTNSSFCATINNTSGQGKFYGIANSDNGQTFGLDSCGNNEHYLPAGGTAQICTSGAPTNNLSVFAISGNNLGFSGGALGQGSGCDPNNLFNPDTGPGVFEGNPLVGTPIPFGSGPGSISNNNNVNSPFNSTGTVYTNGMPDGMSPIVFNSANTGLASNGTVIVGFDAVFAELVNVNNSVNGQGLNAQAGLAGVKSAVSAGSSVLGADLVTLNASITSGLGSANTALGNVVSGLGTVNSDLSTGNGYLSGIEAATQSAAVSLGYISNFTLSASGSLVGMSNGIYQIISNTAGMSGSLLQMSNYAIAALSTTNGANGGMAPPGWTDGSNVGNLTNNADYFSEVPFALSLNAGGTASETAGLVGMDAAADEDSSFWTLTLHAPGVASSDTADVFDLNPMDNPGIAELAHLVRTCEVWLICAFYIFLVSKLMDKELATLGATKQLDANGTMILGNSVGEAAGLAYMPVMIAMMSACPLIMAASLASGIGATWFEAMASNPLSASGHSGALTQAFWLADQFIPINFTIASCLLYAGIFLTSSKVCAVSQVVLKTLIH